MTLGLLGSNGTIGQSILDHLCVDAVYNSGSVPTPVDHLIVAAPSGNRLSVNLGHVDDKQAVDSVFRLVCDIAPQQVTLISTVDAAVATDTAYGANRAKLEQCLQQNFATTVLRLSTLIGPRIRKNLLFDLKHNLFLDRINPNAVIQWCLLDDLPRLIKNTIPGQVLNVVSEPIANRDILEMFRPELLSNSGPTVFYNQSPFIYNRQQIFHAIGQYLQ